MLAVVKTRPEPGIEILERLEPAITQDDHVLLEVAACGVCGSDLHFRFALERLSGLCAR
jgi:threonine dehydrogenase-like Zn-dependent dehydrogenase